MLWSSGLALGSALTILTLEALTTSARTRFRPLQCNAHARARWQAFFAMCHLCGVAISYNGILMPTQWCEFWSFWVAFFIGLQGWFLLAFGRVVHHATTPGMKKRMIWYAVFILSVLSLTVPNDVFGYDFDVPFCIASDRSRLALSIWLFGWSIIMILCVVNLCVRSRPSVEYDHMAWTCGLGFLAIAPIAGASLAFEDDETFFQWHVASVALFHTIVTLRIRGPSLWFAYCASTSTRDRYVAAFETTVDSKHMDYKNIYEAQDDIRVMRDYLNHIPNRDLVDLYNKVNEVCALAVKGSPLYPMVFHDGIYMSYFSNAANIDMPVTITCTDTTPIAELRLSIMHYLHRTYDHRYFGLWPKIKRFALGHGRTAAAAPALDETVARELGSELDSVESDSSSFERFGQVVQRYKTPFDSSSSDDEQVVYLDLPSWSAPPLQYQDH